jgi:hypothetical protein
MARRETPEDVHHHLCVIHLGAFRFHVWAVQALDIFLVENGLHRPDRGERLFELIEQRGIEHTGLCRRFVGVVFEDIPAADDDVFQASQGHEIADGGAAAFRALAQADGA